MSEHCAEDVRKDEKESRKGKSGWGDTWSCKPVLKSLLVCML